MDIKTYEQAWHLAFQAHEGQRYGNYPYIYHIRNVVERCSVFGAYKDKDEAIVVAILHDVIEDHPNFISYRSIYELFGEKVVLALEAITRKDEEDYHQYLVRCSQNKIARMVKSCDLMCNLLDLDESTFDLFRKAKLQKRYSDAIIYLMNN